MKHPPLRFPPYFLAYFFLRSPPFVLPHIAMPNTSIVERLSNPGRIDGNEYEFARLYSSIDGFPGMRYSNKCLPNTTYLYRTIFVANGKGGIYVLQD